MAPGINTAPMIRSWEGSNSLIFNEGGTFSGDIQLNGGSLDINESIADIVEIYISHQLMPNDPAGDALHLAIASFHKCDFLITWNCRHLANANKFGHIRRINTLLGLFVPTLVTPLELIGDQT